MLGMADGEDYCAAVSLSSSRLSLQSSKSGRRTKPSTIADGSIDSASDSSSTVGSTSTSESIIGEDGLTLPGLEKGWKRRYKDLFTRQSKLPSALETSSELDSQNISKVDGKSSVTQLTPSEVERMRGVEFRGVR